MVTAPQVPIPASLLTDCFVPDVPKGMTFGDSLVLNSQLLDALDDCNGRIAAIRRIEAVRATK
ncbi:Rz1-like lysis system protein LysC [Atlantibacter hermannii]|uniref:Rz1-like lysis system protein LysC n=1 Tax=Atlantibacter hermannii TaxID=565 RepID=UPI00406C3CCD